MCQCGCGDYNGQLRMPGPNGKWYVLGVYQCCPSCSTPAGVSIDLMDDEDVKLWGAGKLPIVCDEEFPNAGFAVIDPTLFSKALTKALKACGVKLSEDALEELDLHWLIGGVAYDTAKKQVAEVRKADARIKRAKAAKEERDQPRLIPPPPSEPPASGTTYLGG